MVFCLRRDPSHDLIVRKHDERMRLSTAHLGS
jgi:hypothetical protein